MPVPLIAAGALAVGTIGGAVISGNAQKKAANTAATAETNAANANIAQANQFRAENQANLQPWLASGQSANALIDSFLYGTPAPQPQSQGYQTAPVAGQTPVNGSALGSGLTPQRLARMQALGIAPELPDNFAFNAQGQPTTTQATPASAGQPATPSAFGGYQAFVNSPTYQFPLQEGMRQLNTSLASRGNLNSGDAIKAAEQYGQNYASGQLNNYIGLAENQSNRGLQAGSAIAGVGVNALNSITNSNTSAANAAANAAIATGAANANMYAGIGSALGQFAGTAINPQMSPFASSYGSSAINVNNAANNAAVANAFRY